MNKIGIEANDASDLTRNVPAVYKCIRKARFELAIEKYHFEAREVEFLGKTISPERMVNSSPKKSIFLGKLIISKFGKALQCYLEFVNFYRNDNPRLGEKLNPFHTLPKAGRTVNITAVLKETFDSVIEALSDACELALKQPI